jgi:hypothetical protein
MIFFSKSGFSSDKKRMGNELDFSLLLTINLIRQICENYERSLERNFCFR